MKEKVIKIFIVEDDEFYRKLITRQLQNSLKCKVWCFSNIKDCLGELYQFPDVIILDYMLGDKTGLDSLKELHYTHQKVPVIVLSSQTELSIVIDIMKEGVYNYVVKDENAASKVIESIKKVIASKRGIFGNGF